MIWLFILILYIIIVSVLLIRKKDNNKSSWSLMLDFKAYLILFLILLFIIYELIEAL